MWISHRIASATSTRPTICARKHVMSNIHEAIGFSEAQTIVREVGARRCLPIQSVSVSVAAGRVLAEPVVAAIDLPGFDNSAMDGFAVRAPDLDAAMPRGLRLAHEQFARIDSALVMAPGTAHIGRSSGRGKVRQYV